MDVRKDEKKGGSLGCPRRYLERAPDARQHLIQSQQARVSPAGRAERPDRMRAHGRGLPPIRRLHQTPQQPAAPAPQHPGRCHGTRQPRRVSCAQMCFCYACSISMCEHHAQRPGLLLLRAATLACLPAGQKQPQNTHRAVKHMDTKQPVLLCFKCSQTSGCTGSDLNPCRGHPSQH